MCYIAPLSLSRQMDRNEMNNYSTFNECGWCEIWYVRADDHHTKGSAVSSELTTCNRQSDVDVCQAGFKPATMCVAEKDRIPQQSGWLTALWRMLLQGVYVHQAVKYNFERFSYLLQYRYLLLQVWVQENIFVCDREVKWGWPRGWWEL